MAPEGPKNPLHLCQSRCRVSYLQVVSSYPALFPSPHNWKDVARPPPASSMMVIGAIDIAGRISSGVRMESEGKLVTHQNDHLATYIHLASPITVDGEKGTNVDLASHCNITERAFLDGQPQWMDESVISQWATPSSEILMTLEEVDRYITPAMDQICDWALLSFLGCPLIAIRRIDREMLAYHGRHNNNLNLPDEIDPSWPFHFKRVRETGSIGQRRPSQR